VPEVCHPVFGTFIGEPYDTSLHHISPSIDSWATGDREVLCAVYDEAGQTVGSLAGIGR